MSLHWPSDKDRVVRVLALWERCRKLRPPGLSFNPKRRCWVLAEDDCQSFFNPICWRSAELLQTAKCITWLADEHGEGPVVGVVFPNPDFGGANFIVEYTPDLEQEARTYPGATRLDCLLSCCEETLDADGPAPTTSTS